MVTPDHPITCPDLASTDAFAGLLAQYLRPGDVVLWNGALGAGKTTMIARMCAALGVVEAVSSPTYVICNHYQGRRGSILHLDAYRLQSPDDFEALGLDEFFETAITLVEWGDKVQGAFAEYLSVTIAVTPNAARSLTLIGAGSTWQNRVADMHRLWAAQL